MRRIIKYMLEKIYHYSGSINSWSWSKLYKNRKEGYGYEEE
tara:strand:+ start:225 stop:347 length:123 start_codon:yes stop_codon:yes gene_type:complete